MTAVAVLNSVPTVAAFQLSKPMDAVAMDADSVRGVTGVSWTCRVAVGIVGFGRAVLVEERVDVGRVMKPIVVVDLSLGRTRGEIHRNDETNDDGSWTEHLPSLSLAWFAAGVSDVRNRRRETVGHPLGGSRLSPHSAPVPVDKNPKSYDKGDGWSGFLGQSDVAAIARRSQTRRKTRQEHLHWRAILQRTTQRIKSAGWRCLRWTIGNTAALARRIFGLGRAEVAAARYG